MKILLGLPEYPPYHVGGGGDVFKSLAERYRQAGHEVVVIYGCYERKTWRGKIERYVGESGIVFYRVPELPLPPGVPFLKTVLPCGPFSWYRLRKIIKAEVPDVAHLHGYGLLFVNQLAAALTGLGVRYVYTLHGAPVSPARMRGLIGLAYGLYRKTWGRRILKQAAAITAVSEYSISFPEFAAERARARVINNGIDADLLRRSVHDPRAVAPFRKMPGQFDFLSLGRIEWLKGFQFFIAIMPLLREKGVKARYFIAGRDNGYRKELDELLTRHGLRESVVFLGQLDFFRKVAAIAACDYVVVPSLIENYPAVPLEAMALGKRLIANRAGGIPEIVHSRRTGIVCDVEERESFADSVLAYLDETNDESIGGEMVVHDWNKIAGEYLELLEKNR